MKVIWTTLRCASWVVVGVASQTGAFAAVNASTTTPQVRAGEDRFTALRQAAPLRIALAPHSGLLPMDQQIQKAQQSVRTHSDPRPQIERLGWLYVAKARASYDAGFYKLAEQCALALIGCDKKNADALLLRGHVLQSLHRFKEAEAIARELVAQRELAFDYGLLGDTLVDQGKVTEAIPAYQKMVDLRPDLESYSRVAHVRWLKGDLEGAIQVASLAARAGSVQNAEASAWALTRLGNYQFQAGQFAEAQTATAGALELVKDFPAALLLRGRLLLASGKPGDACESLARAAQQNPLPEYQWTLAEALQAASRAGDAEKVEWELKRVGAATDPRTFAVFLATRHEQIDLAVQLAERELQERADVFTHDALAWALFAKGRADEAWVHVEKALSEETQDARLFQHAAAIAAKLGRADAVEWFARARRLEHLLLPSERTLLTAAAKPAVAAR